MGIKAKLAFILTGGVAGGTYNAATSNPQPESSQHDTAYHSTPFNYQGQEASHDTSGKDFGKGATAGAAAAAGLLLAARSMKKENRAETKWRDKESSRKAARDQTQQYEKDHVEGQHRGTGPFPGDRGRN